MKLKHSFKKWNEFYRNFMDDDDDDNDDLILLSWWVGSIYV
jgi:hypothetical protein